MIAAGQKALEQRLVGLVRGMDYSGVVVAVYKAMRNLDTPERNEGSKMTDKPEIYLPCRCSGTVFIAEGEDEGYCFDERCGLIVRRPTPDRSGEADKTGTGLAEGESGLPEGSSKP